MNDFTLHGSRDLETHSLLAQEHEKQNNTISLIASENLASTQVRHAQSSVFTNKYAEGYPGKRYYGGCEIADKLEILCQKRACELFGAKYANVQPHSGSQANMAVFNALLKPGDVILGMDLSSGGHLTHGSKVNFSGKIYNSISYGLSDDELIDMNQVRKIALEHSPKMIIAGTSAYSRVVDWEGFRKIADEVNAILLVDMAHVAGLIAAGEYPNPVNFADVVTSTTHKTLKGPRGGIILTNHENIFKKINSGVFPGIQGGPLMHIIAAKSICFNDASSDEFKNYAKQVILNSKAMTEELSKKFQIVSHGTDTHLCIVKLDNCSGKEAEKWLSDAGIIVNKNMIYKDTRSPRETSGIRIGTPLCTSRGFNENECKQIAKYIIEIIDSKGEKSSGIRLKVEELCKLHPIA
ncbi:serine hydroxymethyltransferase [Candidatus Cytomitobacter indipagum]|uniref:Serine hydroxymethyltransferase n=1 Tax=Candidatus Cytomitobacter indipagum TaxID=2601575 RepID=A0A5C0UDR0_9PROT|nr:serine hydroxymethyltransferase [Candidatus Cytomitobacter indipagum]QEK37897.1 serine hydroxymethyltransferase [Candidatus Cytomitobacter indipagum]